MFVGFCDAVLCTKDDSIRDSSLLPLRMLGNSFPSDILWNSYLQTKMILTDVC